MNQKSSKLSIQKDLIITSVLFLALFIICIIVKPSETLSIIENTYNIVVDVIGPIFQIVFFLIFIFAVYLTLGKYGNIRMGEEKPEYSTFSYVTMMLLASLASAALYWSFTEWASYYTMPGLSIIPESTEALEIGIAYQFFHWGMTNQATYTVLGIAISYGVYVKKIRSFQVSKMFCSMYYKKVHIMKWIGKAIDFIVVFAILGGLSSSLGLAVPMFTAGLKQLLGIETTKAIEIGVIVLIAIFFTVMAFVGIQKGMKIVSNTATLIALLFLGYIFVAGPTTFIMKNITNSFGLMIRELPTMSLYTDPIGGSSFAEDWTIYFQAFYLNYLPLMGIFIAKISKGRTIREIGIATILGISVGGWLLFGINGSFSMKMYMDGYVDVVELVNQGIGNQAIFDIIEQLPLGKTLLPILILILIIGFVAPSLDSASIALSETVISDGEPPKILRVFWCIMLTVIPICIILADAEFTAIKQMAILVSIPFLIIMIFVSIGLFGWLKNHEKNNK